ncbi:hypothetical protein ACROYT_G022966 [Oculina patagonica]
MALFKALTFPAWITLGLSFLGYRVLTAEYDRVLMFKEPVSDKALEGHVIRTEIVPDYGSCRVKCYLDPNCKSINVGPFDEITQICELNDDSDESPSHLGLVERQRYTYHAVENFCHGNPCPGKYAICQVGFTDKGFRCDCRDGYRGEQCNEDFIPGRGSLVCGSCYKLITEPKETWNNAAAKCKSLGAELVKIESAEENDFLTRTFLTASTVTYWIGLSDQDEEGKWMWTNGSLLANYANWGRNNPNDLSGNQNCGHIVKGSFRMGSYYFDGYIDGEWNDFKCDYSLGYICEKFSP